MWRAGPLLVGSYALLYVIVKALESYLGFGITRLVGPQEYVFWAIAAAPLVSLVPLLLMEPVRIAVISGAYDATLARLRKRQQDRTDTVGVSEAEGEMRAVADAAGLLPSSVDAVAAAMVTAPARDSVEGQGSTRTSRRTRRRRRGARRPRKGPRHLPAPRTARSARRRRPAR